MDRRIAGILAATLLAAASGVSAGETAVSLTRLPETTYEVNGQFAVAASTEVVWEVLTDYENIPTFVRSMRSSRVRAARGDGSLVVEQQAIGGLFFLSKTMRVLLEVHRGADGLRFTDSGRADFRIYTGDWDVRPTMAGAVVAYRLRAQPKFYVPAFILSRAMRRGAVELLDQVRAEIIRRELAK